jgi:hypothetical protein
VAPARRAAGAKHQYACEIQETANGRRRRAGGETRREIEVVPERRLQIDVENEREKARETGVDEAQKIAHEEELEMTREVADMRRSRDRNEV